MAKYLSTSSKIAWSEVDDDTPPGHCTAVGKDEFGAVWLWLFKGDAPSDDGFVGSIQVPDVGGPAPSAYGRTGAWVGLAGNTREALARLAASAAG